MIDDDDSRWDGGLFCFNLQITLLDGPTRKPPGKFSVGYFAVSFHDCIEHMDSPQLLRSDIHSRSLHGSTKSTPYRRVVYLSIEICFLLPSWVILIY